jgi:putative membrane protein
MFVQKQPTRKAPGIFSYIELFSSKFLAYTALFGLPFLIALLSTIFHAIYTQCVELMCINLLFNYFLQIFIIFMVTSLIGVSFTLSYSKKAPVLASPPKGWAIQMNAIFNSIIGGSFLVGQLLALYFRNLTFREVFFMLGIIISYILAFVIYFSFTTVGKYGHFILALTQPVSSIILYSIYTAQLSLTFFIRAMVFFGSCAIIFTIIYARGLFHVSRTYRNATGGELGGYPFIRAFVLSMMTNGHDDKIEHIFDTVGINSSIKIQYFAIRNEETKKIKGLFIVPHVHFGPFKTCGSSDLPELIYRSFREQIPGTTVYHTTTDHTQNLTTQNEVNKVLNRIKADIKKINNDENLIWINRIKDFSRKISNNSKVLGLEIDNVPIMFLTRHPLPSDDIQSDIGKKIRKIAHWNKFKEIVIIDSHNSIIGDEVLIKKKSLEGQEFISVAEKFITSKSRNSSPKIQLLYGVANDSLERFSENDGIGYGGIVVHIFKNIDKNQKTALIHFDANNAYVDIRSYILNMLQNRGIEKGEITTSDSHTVARQFTSRGYSPLGDKIKLDVIIEKLDKLIQEADKNLEPVEFFYYDSTVDDVRIWGNPIYFDTIIDTLQECLRVSQKLLTFSLIVPTFFSLILLLFYYNIPITGIF